EAGTERLRRIVNKGNTEEDLERAVTAAFEAGWQSLKLYFMIGLPGESDEDLDGIVHLIRKASKAAKGGKITASISTFVPKSHTPFQWAGQLSIEETRRRQQYIRESFQRGRARVKFHDPRTSFLEGVLARGDENLADAIELAFRKGARFDGWEEHLKLDAWMEAFEATGIDPEHYLGPRSLSKKLPWDFVDSGVSRDYLVREWEKALSEQTTGDCRFGDCEGCGVCDFEEIYPRKAEPMAMELRRTGGEEPEDREAEVRRYRLRYAKTGLMRFLGHRDLIRAFHRAFRRAGMKLAYSKGFHPHPRLKFSPPLSVGVESLAEYLDFELVGSKEGLQTISQSLEKSLPQGVTALELSEIPLNEPPVSAKIQQFTYEINEFGSLSSEEISQRVGHFHSSEIFPITLARKGKTRTRDLKMAVEDLQFGGSSLTMILTADPGHFVNPIDAAAAILGTNRERVRGMKVLKTSADLVPSRGKDRGSSHE
ncbi:MAG: TIGR03936 family radical SAM-associated protein, partial [Deltaproteobacteria bacterium]